MSRLSDNPYGAQRARVGGEGSDRAGLATYAVPLHVARGQKVVACGDANHKESGLQTRINLSTLHTTSNRREGTRLWSRDLGVLNPPLRRRFAIIILGFATYLRSLEAFFRQRFRSLVARAPVDGVLVRP